MFAVEFLPLAKMIEIIRECTSVKILTFNNLVYKKKRKYSFAGINYSCRVINENHFEEKI